MPQILTWTFSIQREVAHNLAFEATYVGSHSTHLILGGSLVQHEHAGPQVISRWATCCSRTFRPPLPRPPATERRFPAFTTQSTRTVGQSLRPYPQYLNVSEEWGPRGIGRFNSLQMKLTKRYSSGLTLLAFYTWSKNMTNSDTGPIDLGPGEGAVQNPDQPRRRGFGQYRRAAARVRGQRLVRIAVRPGQEVPPSGRCAGARSGWMADYRILPLHGRLAALAITGGNGISALGYPNIRANYLGGDPYKVTNPRDFDPARDLYLNSAAFATPSTFALGNTARVLDWVRGFSGKSESLSLAKRIPIKERVRAVVRADATNPFNFVRWSNPTTSITSANFGKVTGAAGGRDDPAQRHGGVLTGMNRREFAKGLGAALVVSQVADQARPRRRTPAPRPLFTTWMATMAALAATCPPDPGATSSMRCAPFRSGRSRSISSRLPGTICAAKIPQAYRELRNLLDDRAVNARVEMVNGTFSQPFGWANGGESNIRQLLRRARENPRAFSQRGH